MSKPSRALAALTCLAVLVGLASWAPSATATTGLRSTVTVLLTSPHPVALKRLTTRHHLTRAQRSARLRTLVPSARTRHRVVARLRTRGFRVTHEGTWAVTATASATRVRQTFGSTGANGALSDITALGGGVATVLPQPTTEAFRPLLTSGADYRLAYTPAGSSASTGQGDAATTVATIQFAQFNSSNLTTYASQLGLSDPVASGQYTPVSVDGGAPVSSGGAIEVALDQESILATAPTARQRAYFAPNSLAGFADAFSRIAQDAAAYHITAVSVSWGGCEYEYGSAAINSLEPVLAQVNAAGVTIFNSSGDSGIYGCPGDSSPSIASSAQVSYPASSPSVVAVGGTNLSSTTSTHAANTGSNWLESAWSCAAYTACTSSSGSGGSGGGASRSFSMPTWQRSSLTGSYAASSARLVPDIAAVGDPNTGFRVYSGGSSYTVGGTSLSSPVAAAGFTNALADANVTSHAGDIHPALYAAYLNASSTVFRDVTSGQNGATADKGTDPSVSAAAGYDTVTGLGAVLWSALLPYLSVTTGPATSSGTTTVTNLLSPTATARLRRGRGSGKATRLVASWRTVRRSTIGLAFTRVYAYDRTAHRTLWRTTGLSGRHAIRVRPGHVVRLYVSAVDVRGESGSAVVTARARR